jgi:hypothetical protein
MELAENQMVTLTELQSSSVETENLPEGQPSLQNQLGLSGRLARQKPLKVKDNTAQLEFAESH